MTTYATFKEVAEKIGCSPRIVSREARRLGIPRPFTKDDVDRIGYAVRGPHSGMPTFARTKDGHFVVLRADHGALQALRDEAEMEEEEA